MLNIPPWSLVEGSSFYKILYKHLLCEKASALDEVLPASDAAAAQPAKTGKPTPRLKVVPRHQTKHTN